MAKLLKKYLFRDKKPACDGVIRKEFLFFADFLTVIKLLTPFFP
jgi:hypothetical protein